MGDSALHVKAHFSWGDTSAVTLLSRGSSVIGGLAMLGICFGLFVREGSNIVPWVLLGPSFGRCFRQCKSGFTVPVHAGLRYLRYRVQRVVVSESPRF